jgi:signal peptidase II
MTRKILLFLSIVLLDRFTKWWALSFLHDSIHIGSFWNIDFFMTLSLNRGAAWGFFGDFPAFLLLFRCALIALFGYFLVTSKKEILRYAILLILAGALSNIVDTIIWGHVVDVIHVRLLGWDYPVFNVADISITFGSILFLFGSIVNKESLQK